MVHTGGPSYIARRTENPALTTLQLSNSIWVFWAIQTQLQPPEKEHNKNRDSRSVLRRFRFMQWTGSYFQAKKEPKLFFQRGLKIEEAN